MGDVARVDLAAAVRLAGMSPWWLRLRVCTRQLIAPSHTDAPSDTDAAGRNYWDSAEVRRWADSRPRPRPRRPPAGQRTTAAVRARAA